jgi:hypothetical protein
MKKFNTLFLLFIIIISACNVEDLVSEFGNSVITAKSKVGEVLNTAKSSYSQDAQLAAIYGLNVNSKGEVDCRSQPKMHLYMPSSLIHNNQMSFMSRFLTLLRSNHL